MVDDTATVIATLFEEACRRDPAHTCQWVALVDGNNHQIDTFVAQAETHGVEVPIVIDCVHVLEYLWAAAWCFFDHNVDRAIMRRDAPKALLQAGPRAGAVRIITARLI